MKKLAFITVSLVSLLTLAGCGTVKEVSAPCKRPAAVQTAFAEDPRKDCGPMQDVNGDPANALAAIDAILKP